MRARFGLRWQIALVVVLFAASLIALLSSNLAALWLPARQSEMQNQLTAASRRMAEEAAPLVEDAADMRKKKPPGEWHRRLADITAQSLANSPAVEGGFYLGGDWDQFTGYGFPNDPHAPPEPPPGKSLPPPPKGKHPPDPPRRDPPPKERAFILAQCRASLTAEPTASPIVQVLDVPPSRVMVVTEAVGSERPARLTTWVMVRLTRPEQMAADMHRYQTATGLALAGILVALLLTVNLGRNLRLERRQREQLREELRRSEHLAVLGKLLAGVAHEVRNPLAAIYSTAQLHQRLPPQARDPAAMNTILHSVDRLNALVSRLLFFARAGHEEPRPVDLHAVVQETMALVRAARTPRASPCKRSWPPARRASPARPRRCNRSSSTWRPTPCKPCRPVAPCAAARACSMALRASSCASPTPDPVLQRRTNHTCSSRSGRRGRRVPGWGWRCAARSCNSTADRSYSTGKGAGAPCSVSPCRSPRRRGKGHEQAPLCANHSRGRR